MLYQKHHGLPGITQTKGIDGTTGKNGNSIYIGYIGDFFEHRLIYIDNFIRIAQKYDSSAYYTGVYLSTDSSIIADNIMSNITNTEYQLNDGNTYDSTTYKIDIKDVNTAFSFIYDEPKNEYEETYKDYYRYSFKKYGYDETSNEISSTSKTYIKADVKNYSGYNSNIDEENQWWGEFDDDKQSSSNWPYNDFSGTTADAKRIDIQPEYSQLSNIDGFELFTINDNYIFSDSNSKYNDFRYSSYDSNNYQMYSGIDTSIYDENNHEMKTTYLEYLMYQYGYISPSYSNSVDYIKYNKTAFETIIFTDVLNSDIKQGDIIYFYTDVEKFRLDNIIEYMVVITKSLEKCTITNLINCASIVKPFSFKHIDINNNYIYTNNKVCSLYYDSSNYEYGKNLCNMLSYNSDSVINIGNISDLNLFNELLTFNAVSDKKQHYMKFISRDTQINDVENVIDSSLIKITNPYVKKYNIGNIETHKCVNPNQIILDKSQHCYTITGDNYNTLKKTITINKSDIVYNDIFDDFTCGVIDIEYKKSQNIPDYFIDGDNCSINKYIFTYHDNMNFSINTEYKNDNANHIIMFWISLYDGTKYYSNRTLFEYDEYIKNYGISILENNDIIEEYESSENDATVYTPSEISTDIVENGELSIELPNTATDIQLFINSKELDEYYENNWCYVKYETIDNSCDKYGFVPDINKPTTIKLSVKMDSNIPHIDSSINTVRDYVSYVNEDVLAEDNGCDLFNTIINNSPISTKDRYVTVSIKYQYLKAGKKYNVKSYYKLTQPGYIETRKVPTVDINIDSDLNALEMSNNIDNGVLCNLFQFFMNVNISDFNKDIWSSYVSEDDISLSLEIKNTSKDYDTIKKYAILSLKNMYTYHAFTKDIFEDFGEYNNETNYIKMNIYPVDSSIINVYNTTLKELYIDSSISGDGKNREYVYNNGNIEIYHQFSKAPSMNDSNVVILSQSLFNNNEPEKATSDSGVNDSITIKINNIKFSDIKKGSIRFRVFVELGNPIFSKLFFKFYVSNMYITYKDKKESKFYVGRNNLAKRVQTGLLTTYDYMYSSKTFNSYICPISLIAIDKDSNTVNDITVKNNKLYGDSDLIKLTLDTYLPIISNITASERENSIINNIIDWSDFNLKKKYLQDNIKSFYVQPIHISDYYDKISTDDNFFKQNMKENKINREYAYESIKTNSISDAYLSVVYNSYSYYLKFIDDIELFYYNDELYLSSKYNQLFNNSPIFISLFITLDVRDSLLINSMNHWNYEYKLYCYSETDNTFIGHINSYGNGYDLIYQSYDNTESTEDLLSIKDTQNYNNCSLLESSYTLNISELSKKSDNYPDINTWYRSLLWQLKWQYARYYTDPNTQESKLDAYDIVDSGKYYSYYNPIPTNENESKYLIPHNLTYSLYPRCAFDTDNNINIIFMLRCPSIYKENQYEMKYTNDIKNVKFTIDKESYNKSQLNNSGLKDNLS